MCCLSPPFLSLYLFLISSTYIFNILIYLDVCCFSLTCMTFFGTSYYDKKGIKFIYIYIYIFPWCSIVQLHFFHSFLRLGPRVLSDQEGGGGWCETPQRRDYEGLQLQFFRQSVQSLWWMVFRRQKHGEEWFMGMLMAKSHRHDYRALWPQGGARDVCRLINLMKYFDLPQSQSNSPSELNTLSLVGGLGCFFHIMGIIIPTD